MSAHRKILKKVAKSIPPVREILLDRENLRRANEILVLEKKQLELEALKFEQDVRFSLARRYIHGQGVEIGALHMPLSLPPNVKVKYIDYIPVDKLRKQYPELKDFPIVNVDIVDNGEKLSKVKNSSQDFIIANHFLEHCQDPIGTLITFYKKLRGGGILYMAIPDKRYTFDMYRPVTAYGHLLQENKVFPSKQYFVEHCREAVKLSETVKDKKKIEERVQKLVKMNYSIHYHVWTQKEMVEFFYETLKKFSLDIEIEAMINNVHEVVFIIKKGDPKQESKKVKAIEQCYFGKKPPVFGKKARR
jgi:predicted SAM-dependent methyltransferase